eukprot:gene23411-52190_t
MSGNFDGKRGGKRDVRGGGGRGHISESPTNAGASPLPGASPVVCDIGDGASPPGMVPHGARDSLEQLSRDLPELEVSTLRTAGIDAGLGGRWGRGDRRTSKGLPQPMDNHSSDSNSSLGSRQSCHSQVISEVVRRCKAKPRAAPPLAAGGGGGGGGGITPINANANAMGSATGSLEDLLFAAAEVATSSLSDVRTLCMTVAKKAQWLLNCERCTIYIKDEDRLAAYICEKSGSTSTANHSGD